ncbi:TonB-dependent receptor [Maribacter polysiphoniae]|uniref:Outer membrane receptor protein involved in Fe transport n=1 Tax=Maribacter polysiphoniae TaxID=429344 RepID=A0A316E5D2_9FLAO|nr:TonB-dependent receptor [Maribacter polysiphoniae]MBD1260144.1 TonB-dependent receptor [Maribacter polysiphoniae]PWK25604.1 outer membrane receptor protein involved in Fe transport [Maribacter polysiphoniae]
MKKIIFAVIGLLIGTISFAQTEITGNVTDSSGEPIPGANIILVGSTSGTTSDFDGNFSFNTDAEGEQTIRISYLGYLTVSKSILLTGSTVNMDFILEEGGEQLDEVLLTATSTRRSQKETPLSVTSLGAKQLAKVNTSSQADVLRSVPGITAEGGGGEVASNIFVRGLPSGGQYQFNPLQIDGMPVLSTFGLNSSAHDVYFRNDIGMKSLEFVRGGSSILYGVGSVAGIINYTSITGTVQQKTTIRTEVASNSRYKADFVTSGPLGGGDSKTFYALSGFYRYDEGPLITGLPTEGFQLRGNLKHMTEKGSITISGQFIDDQVQFFLPYPLEGGTRKRPVGNDGNKIFTLQTAEASDISYQTPDGIYSSPIEEGVATQGSYVMANFKHGFDNDLKLDAKLRYSKYEHQFNLFLDGSGVGGAKVVETQQEYLDARGLASGDFTFLNGEALDSDALLFENRILDRQRPLKELMADIKLTKTAGNHNITLGTFMSRSSAGDFNVITNYLGEYSNRPRMVNVSDYSINGVTNRGTAYTNRNISSNKIAAFIADEIKLDRWNLDFGLRYERASGDIENEGTASYEVDDTGIANLDNVTWGNGSFTRGHVSANDFALAAAALYKVNDNLSAYGNFSRGYFFPELRGTKFDALGNPASYETEKILQGELGVKYGKGSFSGTAAVYSVSLKDRRSISFVNAPGGGFIEEVDTQDTSTIGFEGTWNWRLLDDLSFNGSFTYQDHEVTKSENDPSIEGNQLRRQPKVVSSFGFDYDNAIVDAGFNYNYTGKKFTNETNAIELDAIGIANLNLGYTFDLGEDGETLRVGTQVFNLFDSDGITEGSPRLGNNQTEEEFFVGRPVLPTRLFFNVTFTF